MRRIKLFLSLLTVGGAGYGLANFGSVPSEQQQALPLKRAPLPTAAGISANDLMTRVYIFADDSMQGRLAGSPGNRRGTDYIASELRRLGVQPAGDNSTFFQAINAPSAGVGVANGRPDPRFRNVVGIIPGSDPTLREEYIALGAHNDHVGMTMTPVDHDSLRATLAARARLERRLGRAPTRAELAAAVNFDSIRAARPSRADSVNNGADDDGSGSMALLEVAEYFVSMPQAQRPKRSLVFVWHSNEEVDLGGSRFFVQHSPVPRQNIIAQVNIDMIGRGGADDLDGGGPDYLAIVGSRRISTRMGDIIDSVNAAAPPQRRFSFDYSWDAPDHPEQIYTRSDHYSYAQAGIPVVFLFTGLHSDYHRVTDEPQYIDYSKLEKVTRLVAEIVTGLGNQAERPRPGRR